jgi:hypothetical protein
VKHDDAGDDWVSSAMVSRFERAMRAVKPGDKVELRVWSGGQAKSVQITAAKASELYKDQVRRFRIGAGPMVWSSDGADMMFGDMQRPMIAPVPPVPMIPPASPMPFIYAPRARVQTFDMNDESDHSDDSAPSAAAARAAEREAQRARLGSDRAIMSSAANLAGAAPAIAATWPLTPRAAETAAVAARNARSATRSGTIRIPGLAIAPVTSDLAEYLGKGSKGGYLVLESSGQWSALRAGDVLLGVDGHCVSDGITTDGGAHKVMLLRKGQRLTLDLAGN